MTGPGGNIQAGCHGALDGVPGWKKGVTFMKIQFLNGGLANQAFQYIFARYYELAYPGESMYMDDTYFALNTVHNGYELERVFGI